MDETGDRGRSKASSPFFGFAAVVFRKDRLPSVRKAKQRVNRQLGRAEHLELHWSKNLKSHDRRHVAAEEVARLNVRIVYSAVEKATSPKGSQLHGDRDALYNYALRLLLERVSWLVDGAGGIARVTLAAVEGLPKRVPLAYLEKLRHSPTQIRWNALHPKVEIRQAATRDGLQLADIAAGALDRAIRPASNPPHRMEPAYLLLLKHRIYTRGPGRVASYGLKALPGDLWTRFEWWAEVNSLPANDR